ncbi:MAG: hypothetical protein Q8R43_03350, partial [Alphaproteobacteria bacterium]|nr:hypothetical protein [Alphaproteobacteria bacterium]
LFCTCGLLGIHSVLTKQLKHLSNELNFENRTNTAFSTTRNKHHLTNKPHLHSVSDHFRSNLLDATSRCHP